MKAFEIQLDRKDVSHQGLSRIFIQLFLPIFEEALKTDPIVCSSNKALKDLAGDLRINKSLTLLVPPNQTIEIFLTRLRREITSLVFERGEIPQHLKSLMACISASKRIYILLFRRGRKNNKKAHRKIEEKPRRLQQELYYYR